MTKKLINVSGPNKHIAGKTFKFTGLNYLRLCHYFITTSKYKKMINSKLYILFFIFWSYCSTFVNYFRIKRLALVYLFLTILSATCQDVMLKEKVRKTHIIQQNFADDNSVKHPIKTHINRLRSL